MILKLMKIGKLKYQATLFIDTLMAPWSYLRPINTVLRWVFLVALCSVLLPFTYANATTISVTSDRNPVSVNESFQLTFTATETPDGDPDFSILNPYLEILNQNKNNSTSIINGQFQHQESWHLNVLIKQTGTLTLPPVPFGKDFSKPLIITAIAPNMSTESSLPQDKELFLMAEISPQNGVVQSQFIYTLRLFRRINISQASLTEPSSDSAIIERLGEDVTYQDQYNNLNYEITERKYAIFPQQPGLLVIPPITLNAEVYRQQRGHYNNFFNRAKTRTKRVLSNPVKLDIQPIPAQFQANSWLPAQALHIEQSWSGDITQMKVGEPLTRTLKIIAQGTTAGQLPELYLLQPDAHTTAGGELKTYPDKPTLNEKKTDTLIAYREEKIALIASKKGTYRLPAIKVSWWNTQTDSLEIAQIPETTLIATLNPQTTELMPFQPPQIMPIIKESANTNETPHSPFAIYFWPGLSLFLASGWLATVLLSRRKTKSLSTPEQTPSRSPYQNKILKQACITNNAEAAKNALLQWGLQYWPENSLSLIANHCNAPLKKQILLLNAILYSPDNSDWKGQDLYAAFKTFKPKMLSTTVANDKLKPLFKL